VGLPDHLHTAAPRLLPDPLTSGLKLLVSFPRNQNTKKSAWKDHLNPS
jgi:hypothetical protein